MAIDAKTCWQTLVSRAIGHRCVWCEPEPSANLIEDSVGESHRPSCIWLAMDNAVQGGEAPDVVASSPDLLKALQRCLPWVELFLRNSPDPRSGNFQGAQAAAKAGRAAIERATP